MSDRWDVIVAGAGPGGSTAAALLATAGCRVLVLERCAFPRFHVGESLLPAGLSVHTRIGLLPDAESHVFKRGAEFVCEASGRRAEFSFADALPGPARHAWHVDRALFDTRVRDCALARGATVRHGVDVLGFTVDDDGVSVATSAGPERARYLIDATGQGRLVARLAGSVVPYRRFGRAAVFAHFTGLGAETWREIGPGDIRIMVVEDGWAWVIPLPGDRLSIGRVSRRGGIRKGDLYAYVDGSPMLSRWTARAERGPVHLVSNFSYRNAASYGARYACVGDAACFLDPVFSSGVALAMTGAERVVDRLLPALAEGREAQPGLMAPVDETMQRGYDIFAALIDRFYNTRFVDNLIFGVPLDGTFKPAVTSVLAGDVWRPDNRFTAMLQRSRRREPAAAQSGDGAVSAPPSPTPPMDVRSPS